MIISPRLKFGFLRAPKTGTTTAEFMLRMTDVFTEDDIASGMPGMGQFPALTVPCSRDMRLNNDPDWEKAARFGPHMNLKVMIEELIPEVDIAQYDVYAYLRDPYQRFISSCGHLLHAHPDIDIIWDIAKSLGNGKEGVLFWPQSPYFKYNGKVVTQPLDFRAYESELRHMIDRVKGVQPPIIPRMNATGRILKSVHTFEDCWTEGAILAVERHYAEDFELYEQFFGKPPRPKPSRKHE